MVTGSGRRSWTNSLVRFLSVVGVGMPVFWSGLLLQLIFFGKLGWLPLDGRLSAGAAPPPRLTGMYTIDALMAGQWATLGDALKHLILPALTLSFGLVGVDRPHHPQLDAGGDAPGLHPHRAGQGALRPRRPLPPLVAKRLCAGADDARSAGRLPPWPGSVLVENIFSWGGIGTYAWSGIFRLDIPVIMAVALATAVIFVLSNLVIDILYTVVDPRIRHG